MYAIALIAHSWLRWIVLGVGLWAVGRGLAGMQGRAWTRTDAAAGRWFVMALDVQFLIGVTLYGVLSPITAQAFADMGQAMRTPVLRFWAVEHISMMVAALVVAHIGHARARRASDDQAKHRNVAVAFILALVVILISIPWPFMSVGRPLLRF